MSRYQWVVGVGVIIMLTVVYRRPAAETSTMVQSTEGSIQHVSIRHLQKISDPDTGDPYSSDPYSSDPKSGDPYSGDPNSSDPAIGDPNLSSDPNSSDLNSGDPNSSDRNSSDPNNGDRNSGDPNSSGPNIGDQKLGDQRGGDQDSQQPIDVQTHKGSVPPQTQEGAGYKASRKQTISSVLRDSSYKPTHLKDNEIQGEVDVCSTEQRLGTIEQYCKEHKVAENFMYKFRRRQKLLELQQQRRQADSSSSAANRQQASDWLDELPDEEILRISNQLWIDPANSVLVCLHSKAGTTTWKAILGNNSMASEFIVANEHRVHRDAATRGLRTADNGNNINEIKHRLRNWYKIAVVRHPFDRLVSSFNDKVLSEDPTVPSADFSKQLREKIRSRHHTSAKFASLTTEKVQFKDFIQLILDGYQNDHWNGPYEDKCHTCLLRYDYIVKLESQTQDARYIIDHKLRGRGLDTHFNQRRPQNSLLTRQGRDLAPYFHTLSQQQYQDLQKKYASDFHMYGYHMDGRMFVAKCSDQAANVTCC